MNNADQIMEASNKLNEAITSLGMKQVCVLVGYVDQEGDSHTLKGKETEDFDLAYHLKVADFMLIKNLKQYD